MSSKKPLNVGYLLRMYPRFSQTFVVNEILELERQGVAVSIASLRKPTDGRFQESICRVRAAVEYIPEYLVESPTKILKSHWAAGRRESSSYGQAFAAALRSRGIGLTEFQQMGMVLRWARKRKLKHVHVHFGTQEATVAYLAHLAGGLPYSLTLHAFDIFRQDVDRRLLAAKINASRFTVTVSEYNKQYLVEHVPGVDPAKVRVNYNGIDLQVFRPNGTPRTPWTVLGIGRLIEKKGFIHLVRALKRLRDAGLPVECTLVGDGPEEERLLAESEGLGLGSALKLAGSLSQNRVRELLARSSCFALPCVEAADGNVDALPTVLLEALAAGCPCVSTRLSGVPEIIESGRSGLLVEPADDAALAEAMRRILTDGELAGVLAEEGRRRAQERFDVRRNVGRMKGWFTETAGPAGARHTHPVAPRAWKSERPLRVARTPS